MSLSTFVNRVKQQPIVASAVARLPRSTKVHLRRLVDRTSRRSTIERVLVATSQTNTLLARFIYEQAFSTERFQEPQRLLRHGFKVYSMHDEDGIIEEIFNRIGTTNKFFVEFGVDDGLENCTLYLLLKNWSGAWIEASSACFDAILGNMGFLIESGRLRVKHAFVTTDNIEGLFRDLGVPQEPDLLSIDIDRSDFWIWKAIEHYRPRVVVIEYNASLKQTVSCTVPYLPTGIGEASNYFGCSLKALEHLGREKGYALVGCNYTGVNAFFVREDCVGDHFARPFTSENYYEPPRYFIRMPNGHPPGFGPFVMVEPGRGVHSTVQSVPEL